MMLALLWLAPKQNNRVSRAARSMARVRCCDGQQPDAAIVAGIEAYLGSMKDDGIDEGWEEDEAEEEWEACPRFSQELADEQLYPAKALAEQAFLGEGDPLAAIATSQSAAAAAAAVSDQGPGVVRLERALSADLAAELREFALSEWAEAKHVHQEMRGAGEDGLLLGREVRLSNVLAPEVRWDVRMRMTSVVRRALSELLAGPRSALGGAFEIASGGREAELWELACMISAPGAASQIIHADCDGAPNPPLLHTAFVALQPVSRELGPTRWLPHTHSDSDTHAAVNAHGDATILRATDGISPPVSVVGLLDTGDASLYDGRILHCGGANTAQAAAEEHADDDDDALRVLFYVTFRHARAPDADSNPAARSILARYDGRVTLGMLREEEGGFDGYWMLGV